MPDDLDRDLLRRFVLGEAPAFEALFRETQVEVYRWAPCVAYALELPLGTVKSRVSRALARLRKELELLGVKP